MKKFAGFPEGKHHQIPISSVFFRDLLPLIDHLDELKVTLYFFRRLDRTEGVFRYLRFSDMLADQDFLLGLRKATSENLAEALEMAVNRGTLLEADISLDDGQEKIYFLNSPRGRAALHAIHSGKWHPDISASQPVESIKEQVNIFRLYEENIGTLTPILADTLKDAEESYPAPWVEEAFHIAVENNKRNWRYISAILERWDREGKHGGKEKSKDRPDTSESRRRFVEGEFSDFIEH